MISCASLRSPPAPRSWETSQYDAAAAALIDAQQWQRAIPILETLRREDPHGQYSASASAARLAVAYAAAGEASQAAVEFRSDRRDAQSGPGRDA